MNKVKNSMDNFDGGLAMSMEERAQRVRAQDAAARSMKTSHLPCNQPKSEAEGILMADIRTDGGTHSRSALDQRVVDEYALAMQGGDEFPPIVLFFDGTTYWLADGFHTFFAAKQVGEKLVSAKVSSGNRRDAKLFSARANAKHGLRRSNADKRRAVFLLLNDPDWRLWTDREIATHCGVDNAFVTNLRAEWIEKAHSSQVQLVDGQQKATTALGLEGQWLAEDPLTTSYIPKDTLALVRGTLLGDDLREVRNLSLHSLQRQKQIMKVIHAGTARTVLEADRELKKRRSEAKKNQRLDAFRNSGFTCSQFVRGNCLNELNDKNLQPKSVRLLLSDVPYGMGLKNKQRVASEDWEPIAGDENLKSARRLLWNMLAKIDPFMAEECHALIFTHWRFQHQFRGTISAAGYDVRNTLVWAKQQFGVGFTGDFGPQYECIIHAVRGGATISPRLGNVFVVPRENVTSHICEKPTELLRQLINCTTQPGELVADPFSGTGATLVAAAQTGREFFGVELKTSYHEEGMARLHSLQPAATYQEEDELRQAA